METTDHTKQPAMVQTAPWQSGELSMRHVLHADLDAFYAAVEVLDNPDLAGKAVMVGGDPENRGVVATASYEARAFGVHSAMPMRTAVRLCPHGIIVHPRFDRYRQLSRAVMDVFHEFTELVEPLSLDEAYLDITELVDAGRLPLAVALELKSRVHENTGLTLSVGAGTSKSVAKIASDLHKPDCLIVVAPGEEREFLAPLAVGRLWGIGPKTGQRLKADGIETIGDLAAQSTGWFQRRFGKRALDVRAKALGEDREQVHTERESKSVSAESTFATDLSGEDNLYPQLTRLAGRVAQHLEGKQLKGKTVTVKARLADFTTFTRQTTLPYPTGSGDVILETAWRLFSRELTPERSFRLLGVGVSGFTEEEEFQLPLFGEELMAEGSISAQ
ncbi:MAG TPA: DNA polymerase IV [Dehalococcoidia bacterium]|nr:DNA polymerase IV [Dehalococcoidia bacterium]